MLAVENIDVYYGKVQALHGVSMKMEGNDIISVIGANGAGKTTLMKTVMGINKPKNGTISFDGKVISGMPAHRIVRESIVYVPEGREIFPEMSVYENLLMGAYSKKYTNAQLTKKVNQMYDMFPRLRERAKQSAGSLSGGEQQMLAVARGLMSSPKLIMFDEPSLGLAPVIVDDLFDIIVRINQELQIPIVLVEQNAFMAMSISKKTYVLEQGRIVAEGSSQKLMNSPEIKSAYLGG